MSENINISKLKISDKANVIFLAIQKSDEIFACDFYAFAKNGEKWQQIFLLPFFNLPQSDDSLGCFPAKAEIDSRVQIPTK